MKPIIITTIAILLSTAGFGQFNYKGTVEYERKVNIHRQMEDMDENGWFEKIKSQIPKFTTAYFNLYFTDAKTLYKPGKEVENPFKMFGGGSPASENVVATDLATGKVLAEKQVFEEKFLINDSVRVTDWKITGEIRTIANYQCRKAVGKICDSVYVVAFYTEDIPVSGGPEMFGGLPGLILEIAIPRLYSTWTAQKIDLAAPDAAAFITPSKGKKSTQKEMQDKLSAGLKDWGKFAARNIWWCTL